MIGFMSTGILLGLSAGVAPGPLLVLVISETVKHGFKNGVKVAISPIITDAPIIGLMIFLLDKASAYNTLLGIISCVGGLFVMYLGYGSLRTRGLQLDFENVETMSLRKGIAVNALSPHPYLFWACVGGPIIIKAAGHGLMLAAVFVLSFYLLLVISKVIVAFLVGQSRTLFSGRIYVYVIRALGLLLISFSGVLFYDAAGLLGLI